MKKLTPEQRLARRHVHNASRAAAVRLGKIHENNGRPVTVPPEAWAVRDRVLSYTPPTIIARMMGDPPPWRSALGRTA